MHAKNDGSGWAQAIAQRGKVEDRCILDGVYYYSTQHPLPVLSVYAYNNTGSVINSTVDWTNVCATPAPGDTRNVAWLYNGELIYPGVVEEDGLLMPVIWAP